MTSTEKKFKVLDYYYWGFDYTNPEYAFKDVPDKYLDEYYEGMLDAVYNEQQQARQQKVVTLLTGKDRKNLEYYCRGYHCTDPEASLDDIPEQHLPSYCEGIFAGEYDRNETD